MVIDLIIPSFSIISLKIKYYERRVVEYLIRNAKLLADVNVW